MFFLPHIVPGQLNPFCCSPLTKVYNKIANFVSVRAERVRFPFDSHLLAQGKLLISLIPSSISEACPEPAEGREGWENYRTANIYALSDNPGQIDMMITSLI